MLNRDLILEASDIPQGEVNIPEWGGSVVVRGFNAKEREEVTEMYAAAQKNGRVQPERISAKIAVMCVLNGKGPMFTHADLDALESKSPAALDRIMEKVQELSGLRDVDGEDAEKNS